MEPKEDKNNEKHQENEIINEKQLNAKKSKSDKPKEKNKGKLNIKQLSQSTQKEINLESVSSLQDFGVTINQSVSDKPRGIR